MNLLIQVIALLLACIAICISVVVYRKSTKNLLLTNLISMVIQKANNCNDFWLKMGPGMQRDSRILSEVITMQQTMDRMKGFHNSLLKITDSEQYIRDIFYLQLLTSVREWVHLSSMRCPGCLLRVIEEKTEENRNPEEKILKKQFHSVFGIVKESWKKYDAKEGEKFGL